METLLIMEVPSVACEKTATFFLAAAAGHPISSFCFLEILFVFYLLIN
jgi:hypothetical protein